MSERTVYYLAGEKAAELVRDYAAKRQASIAAHVEFLKSIGARDAYVNGTFDYAHDVTPPPGLKQYARPKRNRGDWYFDKTPEGCALAQRFAATPKLPRAYELTADLVGGVWLNRTLGYHIFDDAVVLKGQEGWAAPIDCTPVKASEYWLMVEAGEG